MYLPKWRVWFRSISFALLIIFTTDTLAYDWMRVHQAHAQGVVSLPSSTFLSPSPSGSLPLLKAIAIDPIDPFKLNFILEADEDEVNKEQAQLLTKYFLTFLTIPDKDLWVNLSPVEPDRIVNKDLGQTAVGRDMLMQDYVLKQLAASLTYPESELGKAFWQQITDKVRREYGEVEIPVSTLNKVWVVPEKAIVYEQEGGAFIAESRLKVMLEEDYFAISAHLSATSEQNPSAEDSLPSERRKLMADITRQIILPELEREVNEGQHFAQLRQMFHSLILAIWFKRQFRENVINLVYSDKRKITGVEIEDKEVSQKIYDQYMTAMKKGAYDIIKEDYDPDKQEIVPRRYFSGGFSLEETGWLTRITRKVFQFSRFLKKRAFRFAVLLIPIGALGVALGGKANAATLPAGALPANPAYVLQLKQASTMEVSQTIISRGDAISSIDQRYFDFMKGYLSQEDVRSLLGKQNPQALEKDPAHPEKSRYKFDMRYIERNWNTIFNSQQYEWAQEVLVVAIQDKLRGEGINIQEDGDLGPETRKAIELRLSRMTSPTPTPTEQVEKKAPVPAPAPVEVVEREEEVKPPILVAAEESASQGQMDARAPEMRGEAPEPADRAAMDRQEPAQAPERSARGNGLALVNPGTNQPRRAIIAPPPPPPPPEERPLNAPLPVAQEETAAVSLSAPPPASALAAPQPAPTADTLPSRSLSPSPRTSAPNISQPSGERASNRGGIRELIGQPTAVWEEGAYSAQTDGILQINPGIDLRNGFEGRGGDDIGAIVDPAIAGERASLLADLRRKQQQLEQAKRSGNALERSRIQAELLDAQARLHQLNQKAGVQRIILPFDLAIERVLAFNGDRVNREREIFLFRNKQRIRLALEMPAHQAFMGTIRGTIDGHPIEGIPSIRWEFNRQTRKATAILVVSPSLPIAMNQQVDLRAEIVPLDNAEALSSVRGRASTLTVAHGVAQQAIERRVPIAGTFTLDAQEGDRLAPNEAFGYPDAKEINAIKAALKARYDALQDQIQMMRLNPTKFNIADIDPLEREANEILAAIHEIQTTPLVLTAPSTGGIVTEVAAQSNITFAAGSVAAEVRPFEIMMGSLSNRNEAILLPAEENIQKGQRLLCVTPFGELVAVVEAVAPAPPDSTLNTDHLPPQLAVRLRILDPHGMLVDGLTYNVIVPEAGEETQRVEDLYREVSAEIEQLQIPAKPVAVGQAPRVVRQEVRQPAPVQVVSAPIVMAGNATDPRQVLLDVERNPNLRSTDLQIAYEQGVLSADLPGAFQLSLTGSLIARDGKKLSAQGGIAGALNGFEGSFRASDFLGMAGTGFASLTEILTGKTEKEEELGRIKAAMINDDVQTQKAKERADSLAFMIEIAQADQALASLQSFIAQLEILQAQTQQRVTDGLEKGDALLILDRELQSAQKKKIDLKQKKDKAAEGLLRLRGTVTGPLAISFSDPLTELNDAEEQSLRGRLSSTQSPNHQVIRAQRAIAVVQRENHLRGLGRLPNVDTSGVVVAEPGSESLIDVISGRLLRTSELQEGGNGVLAIAWNLIDEKADIEEDVSQKGLKRAELARQLLLTGPDGLQQQLEDVLIDLRAAAQKARAARSTFQTEDAAYNQAQAQAQTSTPTEIALARAKREGAYQDFLAAVGNYYRAKARLTALELIPASDVLAVTQQDASSSPATLNGVSSSYTTSDGALLTYRSVLVVPETPAFGTPKDRQRDSLSPGLVTFAQASGDEHGVVLWSMLTASDAPEHAALSGVARLLVTTSNPFARADALDLFLSDSQTDPEFLTQAQQVILLSPYPDTVERLFTVVSQAESVDTRFLINVIDQAGRSNRFGVLELAFRLLGQRLVDHPDLFSEFTEEELGDEDFRATARTALASFLHWAPEDLQLRLLRSGFWTPRELGSIYVHLEQDDPLALLIRDELFAIGVLQNADQVFRLGLYANAGTSDTDLFRRQRLEDLPRSIEAFVTTSPEWRDRSRIVNADLRERAEGFERRVIKRAGANASDPLLIYIIPDNADDRSFPEGRNGLSSFGLLDGLDENMQRALVASTNSVTTLGRILTDGPDYLRGLVLNRLMQTRSGRMEVLRVYVATDDVDILSAIEHPQRNWRSVLRGDLEQIDHPADATTMRSALSQMAERGAVWASGYEMRTHGPIEGGSNGSRWAMERTLSVVDSIGQQSIWQKLWGKPYFELEEIELIAEIKAKMASLGPEEFERYFLNLKENPPPGCKSLVKRMFSWYEEFIVVYQNNLQDVQRIPFLTQMTGTLFTSLSLLFALFAYKVFHRGSKIKKMTHQSLKTELRRETFLKFNANGNGNGHGPHTEKVIEIPLRRMNPKVRGHLNTWREIVLDLHEGRRSMDSLDASLELILEEGANILLATRYSSHLMREEREDQEFALNESYRRSLNYFNLLGMDTLEVLNDLLSQSFVTDSVKRKHLLSRIEELTDMLEYAQSYLLVLDYRGIINGNMNYKFESTHWLEKSKLYPLLRLALLYSYQINASRDRIETQVRKLLTDGNQIKRIKSRLGNRDWYDDPHLTLDRSMERLDEVIKNAESINEENNAGPSRLTKYRRFIGRLGTFLFPIAAITPAILGLFGLIPLHLTISFGLILGVMYGVGNYWYLHWNVMQTWWHKISVVHQKSLEEGLKAMLRDPDEPEGNGSTPQRRAGDRTIAHVSMGDPYARSRSEMGQVGADQQRRKDEAYEFDRLTDGGVDLADTEGKIDFQKQNVNLGLPPAPGVKPTLPIAPGISPQIFQGFSFEIIGLQEVEEPLEFSSIRAQEPIFHKDFLQ